MNNFTVKVLWAYIILLLAGGLIGFFKAKSKVSLIASVVFAAMGHVPLDCAKII
jgi:uncharacterized membrane protein (UPF0136 family)